MTNSPDLRETLNVRRDMQELLYVRGYLITTKKPENLDIYPFYGNWLAEKAGDFYICHHNKLALTTLVKDELTYFLLGHAYNPFTMEVDEGNLLRRLSEFGAGLPEFWRYEASLTGIYVMGIIDEDRITFWTDCTGMLISYYGIISGDFYCTSHSKLAAEICHLEEDPYVTELKHYRFYPYFGTNLPADISPFKELKRCIPNYSFSYRRGNNGIEYKRFFPYHRLKECRDDKDYRILVSRVARIMKRSMEAIAQKWPDQQAAISVTGGIDSGMTLASAAEVYDSFQYFSYISNEGESVDAYAARDICAALGLPHQIYQIPGNDDEYEDIEIYRAILEQNCGDIGKNNPNDVRKRIYFHLHPHFKIEVKSWVDEIGRARYYKRYFLKRGFPGTPNTRLATTLYKVFAHNRKLVRKTDALFAEYIRKYIGKDTTKYMNWLDALYWEFSWSAGEGLSMTSEHLFSYDITIPYNNRRIVEYLLRAPLQYRINDKLQTDVTALNNKEQSQLDIHIVDINHDWKRAIMERLYLEVNSHLPC